MVWREVIDRTTRYLASKSVPDAAAVSECLAAFRLRTGRGFLAGAFSKEAPEADLAAMRGWIRRLVAGEPLQYVIGEWDFRTLTLRCDRRALIPRPETEGLVSRVLEWLEGSGSTRPLVVDVGTGTGAIALSVAKEFPREAVVVGTDVSEDAISLAIENAERCGLRDKVSFVAMDGLDDFDEPQVIDAIVSNPPYVTRAECGRLDRRIRDYEPLLALDGGESGLDFYRRYVDDACHLLKPGGAVFFEIGEDQGESLRNLLADYGFGSVAIEKDLNGKDRYASGILA